MNTDKHPFYAHSIEGQPKEKWQKLEDHLWNVADLARQFAEPFGGGDWAYVAGLLHDIGKYSAKFQERISGKCIHVDHSTAGAQEAVKKYGGQIGKILAYAIAGHHAGLADGKAENAEDRDSLEWRTNTKRVPSYANYASEINNLPKISIDHLKSVFEKRRSNEDCAFGFAFFIRMLLSCVVDADRLDAEAFESPPKSEKREQYPSLSELKEKFDSYLREKSKNAERTEVNKERAEVLERCRKAAEKPTGFFQLTVPTGGGKTLSSMAFALNHAIKNKLDRVIYVIPYTSIIEQNAEVFREAFGHFNYAVVEHHSNFDVAKITNENNDEVQPWELAIENWDAPIIVTTNVQFFESLFSHHAGRCRKLHNSMNSVVIFDEAQMLPVNLLYPCLRAIEELVNHYHTTVVLCTATQPALEKSSDRPNFKGLNINPENEIVGDKIRVEELYKNLERVKLQNLNKLSDDSLVSKLKSHRQVLCIVNTRGRARKLYDLLSKNGTPNCFHLSANMCPEHRTQKLDEIKKTLDPKNPQSCRVISTQVIEAGVDIDFPVVYREIAGIDSIAQAAGRCNREMRLGIKGGKVFVFEPEENECKLPPFLRDPITASRPVINFFKNEILDIKPVEKFFRNLFLIKADQGKLDGLNILRSIEFGYEVENEIVHNYPFREISEKFQIIDDYSIPVIIKWGNGDKLVNELKKQVDADVKRNKKLLQLQRKLQRFTVNIYPQAFARHKGISIEYLIPESEQFAVLMNMDIYSNECGFLLDDPYFRNPESNIC